MGEAAEKLTHDSAIRFSIARSALLKSLARLQPIVEKRNTIPILANIKLALADNVLQLTATDMDLVATEETECVVEESGALTVPAQTFYDIVRKLPDGAQITLDTDTDSGQVIVEAGAARFALPYLPADDFPVLAQGNLSHEFTLDTDDFLNLIDKSRFAMSTEETRYYLNGVYFHAAGSEETPTLRSVATDGHRLALIESSLPKGAAGMPGVIIPRKTVNELHKLFEEQADEITVSLSENKIRFAAGRLILLSKLVDGTFPDYGRAIPQNNSKVLDVDRLALTKAVDRVSTISTEKTRSIKFTLSPGNLVLTAQSPEAGTAKEELEVTYAADELETGFNSRYMLDMLSQLEGDSVQFLLSDANAPALVSDPSDVRAQYVIMPMRV